MAKSAGLSIANKSWMWCLPSNIPLLYRAVLVFLSATGILAYTLMPSSSSCSGVSMPRRKNTRIRTMTTENMPPSIIPSSTTKILLGFTGFGCVMPSSIILTLPMALDFAMFNSCWRFSNCMYIARPESTSRFSLNISCCVFGIPATFLLSFPFSSCSVFLFSSNALYVGCSFVYNWETSASRKVKAFNWLSTLTIWSSTDFASSDKSTESLWRLYAFNLSSARSKSFLTWGSCWFKKSRLFASWAASRDIFWTK